MFPTLQPGDPSLLQALHAALRAAARPAAPPLDPVVLQALLTCIVARDTHLIIRTNDEDVSAVARLVVWILSSLFAYPTNKLKIRPKPPSPSLPVSHHYFLRSLFLSPSPSSSGSQDESSDPNRSRRLSSRPSRTPRASPISPVHMDPTSLSNVSSKSPIGHQVSFPSHPENGFHHHGHNLHPGNTSQPQLPHAIVISGLENATTSSQRALSQVLAEKRVFFDNPRDAKSPQVTRHDAEGDDPNGPWHLPDGFIAVYICPIDTRERPNIHNTLLDKFAMSCNVLLKPHVRNALQPVPFPPVAARTNSGPHSSPSTPLTSSHMPLPPRPSFQPRHIHSHSGSHLPTLSTPVLPPGFIEGLRQACTRTHISPTLSLYLADLFSATRHHAQVDGTLLTARCVKDAEKLTRAARVVGVDLTGVELLRREDDLDAQDTDANEINEDLQSQDIDDEYEATGAPDSLRKSTGSVRERESFSENQRPTSADSSMPALDVTEVNIARMFPRCVSHRLRIRDGPREEVLAGAVFGATFEDTVAEETSTEEVYVDAYEVRPTVKDILVSVMSEV